ncbi:hypothetical protein MASR1M46_07140 [Bacteroidales bacterium]
MMWDLQSGRGIASFLLPALLILIIHQTSFWDWDAGRYSQGREQNHSSIPEHLHGRGPYRAVIGKAIAYFLLYIPITAYIVGFIPKFFNLPHIGEIGTLFSFMIPFLLAAIFFSMTVSVFVKNRETGLIAFLFHTNPALSLGLFMAQTEHA